MKKIVRDQIIKSLVKKGVRFSLIKPKYDEWRAIVWLSNNPDCVFYVRAKKPLSALRHLVIIVKSYCDAKGDLSLLESDLVRLTDRYCGFNFGTKCVKGSFRFVERLIDQGVRFSLVLSESLSWVASIWLPGSDVLCGTNVRPTLAVRRLMIAVKWYCKVKYNGRWPTNENIASLIADQKKWYVDLNAVA